MSTRNRRLWISLWVGAALIRLLIMPFTMHMDAYQIYSRAADAAYDGEWFGWSAQILIQSLHNLWLLIIRPLLPNSAGIWSETSSVAGVGASPEDYQRFLAYDHVFRAIFLMKLPYVVADLGCAWLITKLVSPARRFAAAAFWLLNPLVIYATAVFGRHDVLAIFVVLLAVLVVRRESDLARLGGLALLGVATLTRFFPIVIVPIFVLAYRRSNRQLAAAAGLLAGFWVVLEVAGIALSGNSPTLELLGSYEHVEYWTDLGIRLRFDDFIFIFPLVYALGLLWIAERDLTPEEFPSIAAASFLVLFGLTFFHPHWSIWLVPFLALTIASSPRLVIYHAIQIVALAFYFTQWGSWTTWELLRPALGDRVASLPDPYDAISAQIEPLLVYGLVRSLLTAVSLWLAWRILEPLIRVRRNV